MRRNKESLVRIMMMLGLAIELALGLKNGIINQYVHPRMNPYIAVSIGLLVIMTLFEIPQLCRVKHKNHIKLYSIMVLPMLLFFILPKAGSNLDQISRKKMLVNPSAAQNASTSQSAAEGNASSIDQTSNGLDSSSSGAAPSAESTDSAATAESSSSSDPASSIDSSMGQDDTSNDTAEETPQEQESTLGYEDGCVVQDDDFGKWFIEVYDHMKAYDGKKVTLKVQVLHDKSLKENEIVGARAIMTCCIADLEYYGYVCRGEAVTNLKENSWVWITGTIHVEHYLQRVEPTILVENVTPADAPAEEYTYF